MTTYYTYRDQVPLLPGQTIGFRKHHGYYAAGTPTPPPPPPGSPSGQPMPVGDLPGWQQIFTDDFTTPVPLGGFPEAVSDRWGTYPYPWTNQPATWSTYDPHRTTSIHDSLMDIFIHTVGGEHLVAAHEPKVNGPGDPMAEATYARLYGRFTVRMKCDLIPGYKTSFLLWPTSETWPRDGEIDFPEGDFGDVVYAFMHRQAGTSGGDQDAYKTAVPLSGGWHTYVIEWLPSRCSFLLDGVKVGESTARVPNTSMRWVLQTCGTGSTPAADTSQGHILIDWVAVWKPA